MQNFYWPSERAHLIDCLRGKLVQGRFHFRPQKCNELAKQLASTWALRLMGEVVEQTGSNCGNLPCTQCQMRAMMMPGKFPYSILYRVDARHPRIYLSLACQAEHFQRANVGLLITFNILCFLHYLSIVSGQVSTWTDLTTLLDLRWSFLIDQPAHSPVDQYGRFNSALDSSPLNCIYAGHSNHYCSLSSTDSSTWSHCRIYKMHSSLKEMVTRDGESWHAAYH